MDDTIGLTYDDEAAAHFAHAGRRGFRKAASLGGCSALETDTISAWKSSMWKPPRA